MKFANVAITVPIHHQYTLYKEQVVAEFAINNMLKYTFLTLYNMYKFLWGMPQHCSELDHVIYYRIQ